MSHILCAMLACAPLIFETRATASSADGPSSAAAANVGEAAGRAASSRNAGTKRVRTGNRGSNQAGAQTRGRLTRQSGGRVGSTRAVTHGPDDVRGPQGVSAVVQPKMATSNGAAPPTAVPGDQSKLAASNSAAAMPAGGPKVAASNSAAPLATRLWSTPRNSAIGGPHAQGLGRVGGPAISRATQSATVDGTQLHHKF
jgi:hypothetical protein